MVTGGAENVRILLMQKGRVFMEDTPGVDAGERDERLSKVVVVSQRF